MWNKNLKLKKKLQKNAFENSIFMDLHIAKLKKPQKKKMK